MSIKLILLAVCSGLIGFAAGCWATAGFLARNFDEVISRIYEQEQDERDLERVHEGAKDT